VKNDFGNEYEDWALIGLEGPLKKESRKQTDVT
jgi:hypothetical protein